MDESDLIPLGLVLLRIFLAAGVHLNLMGNPMNCKLIPQIGIVHAKRTSVKFASAIYQRDLY